jgi:hypothetical protein
MSGPRFRLWLSNFMSSDKLNLQELLTLIAEQIGAKAVGLAVVTADGTTGFLTLAALPVDPSMFGRLSDELYKCAVQAEMACKSAEKTIQS